MQITLEMKVIATYYKTSHDENMYCYIKNQIRAHIQESDSKAINVLIFLRIKYTIFILFIYLFIHSLANQI
jgi:hypothetical protein